MEIPVSAEAAQHGGWKTPSLCCDSLKMGDDLPGIKNSTSDDEPMEEPYSQTNPPTGYESAVACLLFL